MSEQLEELVKLVDEQLEHGDSFITANIRLQSVLQTEWDKIRSEVLKGEPNDELQAACEKFVGLWEKKHKFANGLVFSDMRSHTLMSLIAKDIGLNEGGKCPPWSPEC